jgi:hypothetical protein
VKLHRIHAAPASGKGGCSFDVGTVRWRGEGGDQAEKREMARRLSDEKMLRPLLAEFLRRHTPEQCIPSYPEGEKQRGSPVIYVRK